MEERILQFNTHHTIPGFSSIRHSHYLKKKKKKNCKLHVLSEQTIIKKNGDGNGMMRKLYQGTVPQQNQSRNKNQKQNHSQRKKY